MFAWVILGMTPRLENEVKRSDRSPIYNSQFPYGISRIGISSPPDSPVTIITTGWILGSSNLQSGGTRCFSGRKVFFHLKFASGGHPVKPWLVWKDSPGGLLLYMDLCFFSGKGKGIRGTFDITPIRKGENHHPNSSILGYFWESFLASLQFSAETGYGKEMALVGSALAFSHVLTSTKSKNNKMTGFSW